MREFFFDSALLRVDAIRQEPKVAQPLFTKKVRRRIPLFWGRNFKTSISRA
jgi:hypothetical protein